MSLLIEKKQSSSKQSLMRKPKSKKRKYAIMRKQLKKYSTRSIRLWKKSIKLRWKQN